nr:splicing factor Prp8 [Cryptomonas sp.]
MEKREVIYITNTLIKWTKINQKQYVKNFKNTFKANPRLNLLNIKTMPDKRILLSSLKYIPYVLFCLLKTLPMPWEKKNERNILYHNSGTLAFIKDHSFSFEILFLSQWSTLWILTKKQRVFRKDLIKIHFPIFDDEEPVDDIVQFFANSQSISSLRDSYPLSLYVIKNWFYVYEKLSAFFLKKQNKEFFYFDSIINVALFSLVIRGGIFSNLDQNSISCFSNMIYKDKVIYHCRNKIFVNSMDQPTKNLIEDNKRNYPILYNLSSNFGTVFLKSFRKRNFLIDCIKNKLSSKNLYLSDSKKLLEGLKFICKNENKNIESIENLFIIPFFIDLFFSRRRVSFLVKCYGNYLETISQKNSIKPAYKIPMIKKLILSDTKLTNLKLTTSQYILLRKYIFKISNKKKKFLTNHVTLMNIFDKSSFFLKGKSNWIDVGIYTCSQSHKMMFLLLGRKRLKFLYLDFNFNIKPIRILTTKERKKSRFSNSFHFCREILRFIKILVDIHVQFKVGIIDEFQLIDGVSYVFTHVGHLTGIYRYKYRTINQIRICKSIKQILNNKVNENDRRKYSGFGFWAPTWRIWLFFLRGTVPVLQRWLSNLLSRHFYGRTKIKKKLGLSKQRINSYYDIQLKIALVEELSKKNSCENVSSYYPKIIFKYMNEAWKAWKANISWDVKDLNITYQTLIIKYLKAKSDWYIKTTFLDREKIKRGTKIDKNLKKKNIGRITRLWFKAEQNRQNIYTEIGPYISTLEASQSFGVFAQWLENIQFNTIDFPIFSHKNNIKLLVLSIENLKENDLIVRLKLAKSKKFDRILNNPHKAMKLIKEKILSDRSFSEIGISFLDNFSNLVPIHFLEIEEQIVDSFIDQYLWLEGTKKFLFPNWVKPCDSELIPFLLYKLSSHIGKSLAFLEKTSGGNFFLVNAQCVNVWENIDLFFLKKLLVGILDKNITNYIIAKNNANLFYKDMIYTNCVGIVRGLRFSGFLLQIYLLLTDLILLGLENAKNLSLNNKFENINVYEVNKEMPIIFYLRYISKIFLLVKTKKINWFECNDFHTVLRKLKNKVPVRINKIVFENIVNNVSIHAFRISQVFITLCGYNINMKITYNKRKEAVWFFKEHGKNEQYICAIPMITDIAVKQFENKIRQVLIISNSTTFTKISNRWNLNIIGIVSYFRESSKNSRKFLKTVSISEERMQNRIKVGLNSKMPSRFPPVLFYAPRELGGLGMISMADPFIPNTDLKYCFEQVFINNKEKYIGFSNIHTIPCLTSYILDWKSEFIQSYKIWTEYLSRKFHNKMCGRRLSLEDLKDLWNKGIPRVNTLFFKDRHTLVYNYGWRIRSEMKKYYSIKIDPFWWTVPRHDGKLWNLNKYRTDVVQILGGIENILEHTMFKGTYFSTWEGLFWEKSSGFEQSFRSKNLTNAQKFGLNQIPNRRFTLWWSPTINRANIYIGFRVQLDLTGIFMHGKIPSLKISLVQIFRSHLWQKIHESLIIDISSNLDKFMDYLQIQTVQKEQIHPRKSYKMNSSSADIILYSIHKWLIDSPSLMVDTTYDIKNLSKSQSDKFWVDLQLRWGDFDSHDIERYSRSKFLDYTTDLKSAYPCTAGAIISIDLAYNIFSGYGYWYKNLKIFFQGMMLKIIRTNSSLYVLRERIRKSLHLFISEHKNPFVDLENYNDIFKNTNTWFFDDSCFYRVSVYQSTEGNLVVKPINGVMIVFLPENGKLFFRIIHKTFWQGQKRLTQVARWKVAEEIIKLINYLPREEQPKEIIVLKNDTIDALLAHLIDFPDILIKGSLIKIPFQGLVKIKKIGKVLNSASHNSLVLYNIYDNWLDSVSSFTAFSRLLLILKCIDINMEKIETIFNEFEHKDQIGYFWPKFPDEKWIKIEIILKDMIIDEYCYHKKINPKSLSNNDIRAIILGAESIKVEVHRLENTSNYASSFKTNTIRTCDFLGKNLLVSVLSWEKQKTFISLNDWKIRSIATEKRNLFLRNLNVEFCISQSVNVIYIVPRNIVKYFLNISDPMFRIIGLMFGFLKERKKVLIELRVLLFPPQLYSYKLMLFQTKIDMEGILLKLKFTGFMQSMEREKITITLIREILSNFHESSFIKNNKDSLAFISINLCKYDCEILGIRIKYTEHKEENPVHEKIQIYLTDRFLGFFLVPKNKKWNYFFKSSLYNSFEKSEYTLDLPLSFFDYIHHI